jgi:hypothetical protein
MLKLRQPTTESTEIVRKALSQAVGDLMRLGWTVEEATAALLCASVGGCLAAKCKPTAIIGTVADVTAQVEVMIGELADDLDELEDS